MRLVHVWRNPGTCEGHAEKNIKFIKTRVRDLTSRELFVII